MKKEDTSNSDSPQQLITQLRSLLAEAEELVAGSDYPREEIDNLRERLASAQARLQDFYTHAREKVVKGARCTDEAIRSHPYEAAVVALGLGVLVGCLLRRER